MGLVSVRNWGYRCELTIPQIELMQSDLPHTLYKKKGDGKNAGTVLTEDVLQKQMEANRKARERRGKRTLDDLFNGETN